MATRPSLRRLAWPPASASRRFPFAAFSLAAASAGASSSTKVVATQVAVIVAFVSPALSFPLTSTPVMFTMRVNLPTRSKKVARL